MGSFSQTLFFGGVKRQPEIRLRSQAIRGGDGSAKLYTYFRKNVSVDLPV